MAVGFMGLGTAVSGMNASQRALEVTGHNISNLNTTGYVRQQAVMMTSQYMNDATGRLQVGTGVTVDKIRQIRHSFLDNIYRSEYNGMAYWQTKSKSINDLEAIMGDPMNETLQGAMNAFWNSWHELSKDPSSLTVRAMVRQRAETMVNTINHLGAQINKLQNDLNTEMVVRLGEMNSITERIAQLNMKITSVEAAGNSANDYFDERNVLIDRLAGLASIDVRELADGQVDITVGGYFVVSRAESYKIIPQEKYSGYLYYVPKHEELGVEVKMGEGIISGLMESRGEVSGAKGSIGNGSPNLDTEINLVVDISNTSEINIDNLQNNIKEYLKQLSIQGLNHNIRLITYDGTTVTNDPFGKDLAAVEAAVMGLSHSTDTGNDFSAVISELESITPFSNHANRYAVLFTGESIDGDGTPTSVADVNNYMNALVNAGIKLSVVTPTSLHGTSPDAGEPGWDVLTLGTGGSLYDINATDYMALVKQINEDINSDVNAGFSIYNPSSNILSTVKQQLNAMINVLAREVNKLHLSGVALDGSEGGLFFEPINSAYPMEMGNIRVSSNLLNLNNIVAAVSDTNGDNTIAKQMTELRHLKVLRNTEGKLTLDQYYQAIIMQIGNTGREARAYADSKAKLVEAADNDRDSIMGVSLDEEMTQMMKYKYSYNAATKSISVINDMLDTIINKMGHVGR